VESRQHSELLDPFLDEFGIEVQKGFNIMRNSQSPGYIIAGTMSKLESIFLENAFDLSLVQGDTSTALVAALTSFHFKVSVGHIEAGLRTNDFARSFPEEMNRVFIDRLSTLHFAPTKIAKDNLLKEELCNYLFTTGNTVIDVAMHFMKEEERKL
jgi:UDP-N-acetylglucosamine 2-epimerase (non-hydrolysing)